MDREQLMGDIIVALVREAGGKLFLSNKDLAREPDETVYIENVDDGYQLALKDIRVIQ